MPFLSKVSEVLANYPDYDLLITGYSLGAGEVGKAKKSDAVSLSKLQA